jgi:hypothetical protein
VGFDAALLARLFMRFSCRRSPRIAIATISGCALVSLYLFQRDVWHTYAVQGGNPAERFVGRYELLRPMVPIGEVTRFIVDEEHADTAAVPPSARVGLAQYALTPRRVASDAASRWVIVDSDCPGTVPKFAAKSHWTLVADLHNGVRLYRTDVRR